MVANILAPKESNFEERISITVEGLKPNQQITVAAMVERNRTPLVAFANYEATNNGSVDLSTASALPGGTYVGCAPMGLFWSLETVNPRDLLGRVVAGLELDYLEFNIRVIESHHQSTSDLLGNINQSALLAQVDIKRMFMTGGIKRIIVKHNDFRGVLFLPEGNGPFPAVIDIVPFASGIAATNASLFARNGFACLHVIFQGYEGLKDLITTVEFDYFVGAYNYLMENPIIDKDNIAFYGLCVGAGISLEMARCLPNVKAVVAVQPMPFAFHYDYSLRMKKPGSEGEEISIKIPGIPFVLEPNDVDGEIVSRFRLEFENGDWRNHSLEVGEIKASLLFFYSKLDPVVSPDVMLPMLIEQLESKNKTNFEIVVTDKGGHFLAPPYTFMSRRPCVEFWSEFPLDFGGDQKEHSEAQEEMWQKTLAFLRHNLFGASSRTSNMQKSRLHRGKIID